MLILLFKSCEIVLHLVEKRENKGDELLGVVSRERIDIGRKVTSKKRERRGSEDDAGISGFLRRGFSIFRGINPSGHEETSEMAKRGPVLGGERERERGRARERGGPIQFS